MTPPPAHHNSRLRGEGAQSSGLFKSKIPSMKLLFDSWKFYGPNDQQIQPLRASTQKKQRLHPLTWSADILFFLPTLRVSYALHKKQNFCK